MSQLRNGHGNVGTKVARVLDREVKHGEFVDGILTGHGLSHRRLPNAGALFSDIEADRHQSARGEEFELWYQAKVELRSFSICGAEALPHVRNPKDGVSGEPPSTAFEPSDERWLGSVRRAFADWSLFAGQGAPLKISVDAPAPSVIGPAFADFVSRNLPRDPRFPGFVVEISENGIARDRNRIGEIAGQLRLYKVGIAVDDFGSATSSLSYLQDFAFIELKLDRSFVTGCSSNPLKHCLCQTVVDLARHFRASVCAQGVDRPEDLQSLLAMGCDAAQGALFAPPMPARQFAMMLQRQRHLFPFEPWERPARRAEGGGSARARTA